ncbi:16103_t:CDS:2 [Funneliformis caledonium]|uniref:16103_t:CDS:1 n=1 Tax=Funneliformis caledonium TaxID=1117310 RepID=A0A9N8ZEV1_9GLOM|nr:16103_t:CDS:2 [Funneliformis caledonium]
MKPSKKYYYTRSSKISTTSQISPPKPIKQPIPPITAPVHLITAATRFQVHQVTTAICSQVRLTVLKHPTALQTTTSVHLTSTTTSVRLTA